MVVGRRARARMVGRAVRYIVDDPISRSDERYSLMI